MAQRILRSLTQFEKSSGSLLDRGPQWRCRSAMCRLAATFVCCYFSLNLNLAKVVGVRMYECVCVCVCRSSSSIAHDASRFPINNIIFRLVHIRVFLLDSSVNCVHISCEKCRHIHFLLCSDFHYFCFVFFVAFFPLLFVVFVSFSIAVTAFWRCNHLILTDALSCTHEH